MDQIAPSSVSPSRRPRCGCIELDASCANGSSLEINVMPFESSSCPRHRERDARETSVVSRTNRQHVDQCPECRRARCAAHSSLVRSGTARGANRTAGRSVGPGVRRAAALCRCPLRRLARLVRVAPYVGACWPRERRCACPRGATPADSFRTSVNRAGGSVFDCGRTGVAAILDRYP